jgi:hypothetical protein
MPTCVLPDLQAPLAAWVDLYASLGWRLFPCRGKVPLFPTAHPPGDPLRGVCKGECGKGGHGLYDATDDPFTLATWWRDYPTANIAWALGAAYWAPDIDPRAGGDATWFALQQRYGDVGHVLLSHTGSGGNHYPFVAPPGGVINKADIGPGIDVQGNGSYIILPPSIHPETGKPYMWDLVDGLDEHLPQRAPAWLEHLVMPAAGAAPAAQTIAPGAPIPNHTRNETLARLAINMARGGFTEAAIRAALAVENRRCVPPLDDAELDTIVMGKTTAYPAHPVMKLPTPLPLQGAPTNGTAPTGSSNGQAWGTPAAKLVVTDLADMYERTYPLPKWLIPGLIPEGLVFFVGSPKSSKTYLAYSLALSLAFDTVYQGKWLDHYEVMNPGPVVYITLEDDESDSFFRTKELAPKLKKVSRDRFFFVHGFPLPRLNEGLLEVLRDQILEVYHPALVVLDPISYLYASIKKGADQFTEVRDMLLPLRWLGRDHHCIIAGIDHRRKKTADDVDIFETTYGSNAKLAIADGLLMIVRDDKEITIHGRIRKAQDCTLTLGFEFLDSGQAVWTWKGSVYGLVGQGSYGDLRQKVLNALSGSTIPLSIADLIAGLNMPDSKQTRSAVYQVLFRAQKTQEVQKTTRNQYVWSGGN